MRYASSETLIRKIKEFEGCRLSAYRDSVGVPTIGYGHTKGVKMGMRITMQQAEMMLRDDLKSYEVYVNDLGVCTTQGQFDALVDFAYNLGNGALGRSTLLRLIRQHAPYSNIKAQFLKWVYAGGKRLTGLVKRRTWEAERYAQ